MDRPAVSTVIVGATRTEQLEDNLKSVEIQLDSEATEKLDEISDSFRYDKPFATYRLS
ncbi:Aldo/keto reductase family protein [compost metagenome]